MKYQEGYMLIQGGYTELPEGFGKIPGLPDMPVPKPGKILERAILNCSHCGRELILNPERVRPRGHCAKCHHYICDVCDGSKIMTGCVSIQRTIDDLQESYARNLNIGEI